MVGEMVDRVGWPRGWPQRAVHGALDSYL